MSWLQIAHFLIAACHLGLSIFILSRSKKQVLNYLFSAFTFLLSIWSVVAGLLVYPRIIPLSRVLLLSRFSWFIGIFALHILFCISSYLYDKSIRFIYALGLWIVMIVAMTNLVVSGMEIESWGYGDVHGPLHLGATILTLSYIIAAIVLLKRAHFLNKMVTPKNLLFFWGTAVSLLIVSVLNLILPEFFKNNRTADYGPLSLSVFFLTMVASFYWSRMLEIRLKFNKTAIYLVLSTIVVSGYGGLVLALHRILSSHPESGTEVRIVIATALFSALASGTLGVLLLLKNRNHASSILFGLFCIVTSIWSVMMVIPPYLQNNQLLAIRSVMFLAIIQTYLFALLGLHFPVASWRRSKLIWSLSVISLICLPLSFSQYVFVSAEDVNGMLVALPGPMIGWWGIVALLNIVVGFSGFLLHYRRSSDPRTRKQILTLFFSSFVMFISIYIFNFVLPAIFKNTTLVVLAPVFTLPFIISGYIAILKLRLLDIRLVLRKTTPHFIIFIILIACYSYLILLVRNALSGAWGIGPDAQAVILVTAIVIGALPLQRGVDRIISHWFTGRRFLSDVIKRFDPFTPSLYILAEEIAEITESVARARRVLVLFFDPHARIYVAVYPGDVKLLIYQDDALLEILRVKTVVTLEERIATNPLRQLGMTGVIGLRSSSGVLGLVFFEAKKDVGLDLAKLEEINERYAPPLHDALRYVESMGVVAGVEGK